jgi:hypothetical protein
VAREAPGLAERTRRGLRNNLEVVNPAPIWRRCLTESGMRSKATTADRIIVAVFIVLVVAMLAGLLTR